MTKVIEAIENFTRLKRDTHNDPIFVDRILARIDDLEKQVNMAKDNGEQVCGKKGTFTDGDYTWYPIRVPHDANSEPNFKDYDLQWPLELHVEGIGWTGWGWKTRRSYAWGMDFDLLADHAKSDGISAEEMERVREAAMTCPLFEGRKSTGGKGTHLYIYADEHGIPSENHTIHAYRGLYLLGMASKACNFDFAKYLDCAGGNMWYWHRKMTPENEGLKLLWAAKETVSASDFPPDWRDHVPKKKKEKPKATTPNGKASVEDDANHNLGFGFMEKQGWANKGNGQWKRPGTDKDISASVVTAEDGTQLFHVFTSNAPPLEKGGNYNAFRLYAEIFHNGDKEAARADLVKQGFGRITIPLITSAELDSGDYELNYLIDGFMVEGQPMMFAGPKKGMKTTLLLALAISLATGLPFLDCFVVAKAVKVVILSGESGMGTLQETARRICKTMGIELSAVTNLLWSDFLPKFNKPEHLDAIERMIQENAPKVVIVDPAYLAMPGADAPNLMAQGELLYGVSQICQRYGAALVIAHHTRKLGKHRTAADYQPLELDDMSFVGFAEFARQWILLNRREPYESGTGHHKLWMGVGGSAGHSSLHALDIDEGPAGKPRIWEVSVLAPEEARAKKKGDSIRERIITAAKTFPKGEAKTNIFAAAVPILKNDLNTRNAFDSLIAEKVLRKCTIKKNGQKHTAYRLAV